MTSPNDSPEPEHVDLSKADPGTPDDAPLDFDPYRFGLPDHPVPPEFAPPGYRPPEPPPTPDPYSPYGPGSPYGTTPPDAQQQPAWPPQAGPPYGQPPYGQPPTSQQPGQPPTSPYGSYPAPPQPQYGRHNHGKAVAALVLGIVSVVFCWLTIFDAVFVIPGIVFAVGVLSDKRSANRGMAIAGLICAIVGALAAIALLIWLAPIAKDCSGVSGSQYKQCIQDHI